MSNRKAIYVAKMSEEARKALIYGIFLTRGYTPSEALRLAEIIGPDIAYLHLDEDGKYDGWDRAEHRSRLPHAVRHGIPVVNRDGTPHEPLIPFSFDGSLTQAKIDAINAVIAEG